MKTKVKIECKHCGSTSVTFEFTLEYTKKSTVNVYSCDKCDNVFKVQA